MADDRRKKDTGVRIDSDRVDVHVSQDTADDIVHAVSPHLKWLVFAAAFGMAVVSLCFGISLLWKS